MINIICPFTCTWVPCDTVVTLTLSPITIFPHPPSPSRWSCICTPFAHGSVPPQRFRRLFSVLPPFSRVCAHTHHASPRPLLSFTDELFFIFLVNQILYLKMPIKRCVLGDLVYKYIILHIPCKPNSLIENAN